MAALALAIAGCGGENGEAADVPESSVPEAAGSEWSELVEAASGQDLNLLSRDREDDTRFVEAFQEAFPNINVQHSPGRPTDIATKVLSEQQAGLYEWDAIFSSTANLATVLEPAGAFQDIPPLLVREDAGENLDWGAGFELYAGAGPQTLITAVQNQSYVWVNRDEIPASELATYADLAKPEFKGKFAVGRCQLPNHSSAGLMNILTNAGEDVYSAVFTTQEPTFFEDGDQIVESMIRGELPISIGHDRTLVKDFLDAGTEVEVEELMPEEGGNLTTMGVSIFKDAPNKEAAQVFLNWMVSEAGQQAWIDTRTDDPSNSRLLSIETVVPEDEIDWERWDEYASWSTIEGSETLERVIEECGGERE